MMTQWLFVPRLGSDTTDERQLYVRLLPWFAQRPLAAASRCKEIFERNENKIEINLSWESLSIL